MNEATSSSATPRTKATAKTTAKAAATKTTRTAAKSTAKTTTKKPTTKRTSKPKTATKRTVGETPAPIINRTSPEQFGRVNVLGITPSAENGLYPARVELGEAFKVTAQVFIEGRTKAGATVSVRNTRGTEKARFPMTCTNPGLDRWEAMVKIGDHSDLKPWEDGYADVKKQLGEWHIVVEGWEDTYASWLHDAQIKVEVGDDVENALESGAQLLERWAGARDSKLTADDKKTLREAAKTVADKSLDATARLAAATTDAIASLHETNPLRDGLSASNPQRFRVERPKSSFAAWYQFFPRSEGAYFDADGKIVQGTLKTALSGLDRAKAEGFDIVYLPPIFPIGVTNRKGRNNTLIAGPHDPGSPFGIGSELGGHDTVDPLLGTMDDFKAFCAHAHELGLEVALDFALQCSPDHPWVKQHPNWFRTKPDGTIAFAENPPKKYQDIYPIDFNADMEGIEAEVERIMDLWVKAGVTIFRVDNPHTKPVRFWQDVIAAVTKKHPEVLFLAEAFTRPGMMRALSYAGFTQSHCYFPWRNSKEELEEYLAETNGDEGFYQHNTFWPSTPDIMTAYLRDNGIAGHAVRAVLAAMGSPSWGIYNGYELIENKQRPGFEEQIDNEKYEVKVREWDEADKYGISELLTSLNKIRSEHPACRSYHNLHILPSDDAGVIAFLRQTPAELTGTGKPDTVIVVVNLDGHNAHQSIVHIELPDFGFATDKPLKVREELTGREFDWGWDNYVSLAPWADVAHVLTVVED
ncbi:alpha-1,4-glucan--maltose-1-phosphate maltosyltransferase [Bifidobacterium adolescentis]|uniref:alpha-1,4-glucan--maltose-1-phosphate maltosyltransferase n=1 Tax=Bifidobacterium adolescentis TaxID=1680 RepID=UPI00189B1C0D|nr:alpha-1,4-glucan--maltose-1-phosphate maltosyltransferase [Bifidobacterium adolescentis]MDB1476218.1 alpha-1,4-glucan--maltose-1-phosphate maltosyltransferase [Bifidobacterium adolescentis]MDB1486350.1 alpha-1,4-glucan--maltose-1-phosphate maltosyltransferase [Bifidobacterium adolescentis]MDB1487900.1 alpha-1,4-glucan--maltose-1-phosphate maltosyltransferase [Bifidobacterium adolescentis]MDB1489777.1 alpha-1,4-glucan--maltose-1-phosphate maltosyltransferase [Bifidobacterium adolescentis]MDB